MYILLIYMLNFLDEHCPNVGWKFPTTGKKRKMSFLECICFRHTQLMCFDNECHETRSWISIWIGDLSTQIRLLIGRFYENRRTRFVHSNSVNKTFQKNRFEIMDTRGRWAKENIDSWRMKMMQTYRSDTTGKERSKYL